MSSLLASQAWILSAFTSDEMMIFRVRKRHFYQLHIGDGNNPYGSSPYEGSTYYKIHNHKLTIYQERQKNPENSIITG